MNQSHISLRDDYEVTGKEKQDNRVLYHCSWEKI